MRPQSYYEQHVEMIHDVACSRPTIVTWAITPDMDVHENTCEGDSLKMGVESGENVQLSECDAEAKWVVQIPNADEVLSPLLCSRCLSLLVLSAEEALIVREG